MTQKVRVYRVELLVIDFDGIGADSIKQVLETTRYPNHCVAPNVRNIEMREVDWSDDHPLNKFPTRDQAYKDLFSDE